jgi:predicted DNA repair protein MutK
MNIKRMTIGTIVGGIVLYILGVVIWQMLFADFFAANAGSATGVAKEMPVVWAIALGSLLYAKLITYVLETGSGTKSVMDGLKAGAVVGLLLWGTVDFIYYGYFNLNNLTGVIADTVLEGVRGGIVGAVIAGVLAKVGD